MILKTISVKSRVTSALKKYKFYFKRCGCLFHLTEKCIQLKKCVYTTKIPGNKYIVIK